MITDSAMQPGAASTERIDDRVHRDAGDMRQLVRATRPTMLKAHQLEGVERAALLGSHHRVDTGCDSLVARQRAAIEGPVTAWRRPASRIVSIVAAVAVLTAAHFALGDLAPEHPLHMAIQVAYLVPVFAGAVLFGLAGGIATSAMVALAYSLHLMHWWPTDLTGHLDQTVMLLLFVIVGPATGFLVDVRSRHRASAQDERRAAIVHGIAGLASALGMRDANTRQHCERVADLAVRLGRTRGLSATQLEVLELSALVHDLGKIGIPDDILAKPEALTPRERAVIEQHPRVAAEILDGLPGSQEIARAVLCHHEQPDGHGYPAGLQGNEIPVEASILRVADAYCALTDRRPYRDAIAPDMARRWIRERAGTAFDAKSVQALEAVLEVAPSSPAVGAIR